MLENIAKRVGNHIVYDTDINLLFHNWRGKDESVVIVGPHDDDPLIGAGLLINSLVDMGVVVHLAILTDGRKGYCKIDQIGHIISTRLKETENAYASVGVDQDHIKRFELPDSDLYQHAFKWETFEGRNDGLMARLFKYFREIKATRFLLPNDNDFHLDHKATLNSSLYAAIQASEPIIPDMGEPCRRDTILKYGVWSPFSDIPDYSIRTSQADLERKLRGIFSYRSQEQIASIKKELSKRGPFEFFQEHEVRMFPAEDYVKLFWGR